MYCYFGVALADIHLRGTVIILGGGGTCNDLLFFKGTASLKQALAAPPFFKGAELPFDHIVFCDHLTTWNHYIFCDHLTTWNHYISDIALPLTVKLGRMVTYLEGLLFTKPRKSLITWSCKVTWKMKTITFYDHQTWQDGDLPWWAPHKVTWPFEHSIDKLKPLYLQYRSSSGHQTWQSGDSTWGSYSSLVV